MAPSKHLLILGILLTFITIPIVVIAQTFPGWSMTSSPGWGPPSGWTITPPVQPQQPTFPQGFPFQQQSSIGTYFTYAEKDLSQLRAMGAPHDQMGRDDLMGWDHIAMQIVKARGYPPTVAGRLYSNIAVAQREAMLIAKSQGGMSKSAIDTVSAEVICTLSPDDCAVYGRFKSSDPYAQALSAMITSKLSERLAKDAAVTFTQTAPQGQGYWTGQGAVTPEAGMWQTWGDTANMQIAPPPAYGTPEDLAQIQAVRDAAGRLNAYQMGSLLHWAGSKGSETPAGLWLNYMDEALMSEQADIYRAANARAAVMASIHDAFVGCWKAKFRYWTARPTQRDPSLPSVIPVPNFPSYPSGHATISGAAAKALGQYFPNRRSSYEQMAREASDGRVWAGIHFPIDSENGMKLGSQTAEQTLQRFQ